jgi:hypothetical protein
VQSNVDQISRHDLPHRPLGCIGQACRDGIFAKTLRDLVIEPGWVAKLKRVPDIRPCA